MHSQFSYFSLLSISLVLFSQSFLFSSSLSPSFNHNFSFSLISLTTSHLYNTQSVLLTSFVLASTIIVLDAFISRWNTRYGRKHKVQSISRLLYNEETKKTDWVCILGSLIGFCVFSRYILILLHTMLRINILYSE